MTDTPNSTEDWKVKVTAPNGQEYDVVLADMGGVMPEVIATKASDLVRQLILAAPHTDHDPIGGERFAGRTAVYGEDRVDG